VDEDTRRIEAEIRAERHALDRNLQTLETQAKALTDWRTHYERHPGAALGLAFGTGLLLSLGAGRSTGRRASSYEPSYETPVSAPRQPRAGRQRVANVLRAMGDTPRARHQVTETWQNVVEALVGLAAVKAVEWIGNAVPGFRDEYDARQGSSRLSGARIQA
jgi:hypothetical protein